SLTNNPDYIFEPKLDGFRALCYKKDKKVKFESRNANDLTTMFPELTIEGNILPKNCILDGEIIIYDEKGKPDFNLMQKREINAKNIEKNATYIVFDILNINNKDVTKLTLIERK